MAEGTEALKHNFLLRGFFRNRGYFNLTSISPDQYRKDRLFGVQNSDRAWLPADELFRSDSRGTEELTAGGRSALNGALANYGERILQTPIVVEGYSDSDNVGERLAVSRLRAILVRNYVESHFHLDSGKVGAVALANRPPEGSAHATWNGIVIVLPKEKR
jgi:outer membrane protein OmpA-like peptidoglycan-associated protein